MSARPTSAVLEPADDLIVVNLINALVQQYFAVAPEGRAWAQLRTDLTNIITAHQRNELWVQGDAERKPKWIAPVNDSGNCWPVTDSNLSRLTRMKSVIPAPATATALTSTSRTDSATAPPARRGERSASILIKEEDILNIATPPGPKRDYDAFNSQFDLMDALTHAGVYPIQDRPKAPMRSPVKSRTKASAELNSIHPSRQRLMSSAEPEKFVPYNVIEKKTGHGRDIFGTKANQVPLAFNRLSAAPPEQRPLPPQQQPPPQKRRKVSSSTNQHNTSIDARLSAALGPITRSRAQAASRPVAQPEPVPLPRPTSSSFGPSLDALIREGWMNAEQQPVNQFLNPSARPFQPALSLPELQFSNRPVPAYHGVTEPMYFNTVGTPYSRQAQEHSSRPPEFGRLSPYEPDSHTQTNHGQSVRDKPVLKPVPKPVLEPVPKERALEQRTGVAKEPSSFPENVPLRGWPVARAATAPHPWRQSSQPLEALRSHQRTSSFPEDKRAREQSVAGPVAKASTVRIVSQSVEAMHPRPTSAPEILPSSSSSDAVAAGRGYEKAQPTAEWW